MKTICELVDGDHIVNGQFLINNVNKGVTSTSRSYLTITLQDSTGTIEAKKWDVDEGDEDTFVSGNIVSVEAEVISYKGTLQIKVLRGLPLPKDGIDFTRFVPSAPVKKEVLEAKLQKYLDSLQDGDLKTLTCYLVKKFHDCYVIYPAAVRNHHAYASGLLYHSICMADLAEQVAKLYPNLNRDVLIAGTIIHDIGKTIELSGPIATKFTLEGRLLGHISIMAGEIRVAAKELNMTGETPLILEHMVLSHHTKPEFGSPVPPETPEAVALSMIDDFDAKMNIVSKALETVEPGEWSSKIFTMDDRYFYNPLYNKK
jgi:3'-5' exoribonuclease